MRQIASSSLSNQNISSALLCYTYTADADREIFFRLFVDQVAGNGTYTAYVTVQRLGAGSAYEIQPRTSASVASGVTAIGFTTIAIPVKNTDVVKVYVVGLAGDTTTPDIVTEVWEADYLRPGTAGQHSVDVTSGGAVGIDWGNVENKTTVNDLTQTMIKGQTDSVSTSISEDDIDDIVDGLTPEVDRILSATASNFARSNGSGPASQVSVTQRDTWDEQLLVTPFSWAAGDKLYVTISRDYLGNDESDGENTILQWLLTNGGSGSDGLTYINGAAAGVSRTKGSISVTDDDAGVINIDLDESVSALIKVFNYFFDVVHISSAGIRTSLTYKGSKWTVEATVTGALT